MSITAQSLPQRDCIVVGAGYGGLAAALALHKVGLSVLVLERAPSPRQEGFSIGAFSNSWRAFEELGVADEVRKDHLPMKSVNYADSHDNVYRSLNIKDLPYPEGLKGSELRVIRRLAAPVAMTNALPKGTVHYGGTVVGAKVTPTGAEVELADGQKLAAKMVVLADGVHSKSAQKYHKVPLKVMDVAGWRAMAELDAEEEPEIVATFTSGPNTRVGTIPVTYDAQRKKMLWYYFMAASMKEKEMKSYDTYEKHIAGMRKHMTGWKSPHMEKLLAATQSDSVLISHIYERRVKPGDAWFEGCLSGVGDCAHATRPDLGQGGAMAIEDGVELGVYIKEAMEAAGKPFGELSPGDIAAALRNYETGRSHRVFHIIDKSSKFGTMFLVISILPRWLMRFILAWLIQPATALEHTVWAPHGRLRPPSLPRDTGSA
ncbi:hypothetical protein CVIRNUC_008896 [Coccomyxa viridis]|uniref:FAD-binding domain-containing protein n=1 Tax=Coccomyxa viridis TaxID=1274662 RepID=A0AAV1IHJ8_9CHLO|nr:hypothetical protein CVIRNUC_008896 [Coccomyxa viridis]